MTTFVVRVPVEEFEYVGVEEVTIEADGWRAADDGSLELFSGATPSTVLACFTKGAWLSIYNTEAIKRADEAKVLHLVL